MKKDDLWWKIGMDTYFRLPVMTIGSEFVLLKGKAKANRLWSVDGFDFKITDKDSAHWDVIAEQLWAVRMGLA